MHPNPIKKKQLPIFILIVASLAVLGVFFRLQANSVSANSSDIQLAENTYPGIVGSRIDTCVLCHTSNIPSLNPYGAAYKGQGRGLASSLRAIESIDSDIDQFTNLQELTALTFPGNPADHPVAPTATNTPFQPASPTPTKTRTPTQPAATSTSTSTRTPTTAAATSTSTSTSTATTAATSVSTSTRTATQAPATSTVVVPSAAASSTATARPSRTPSVKPTYKASVVPTCVSIKKDGDDDEDDDQHVKLNCSHKPNKGEKGDSNSEDNRQNNSNSDDQDDVSQNSSHRSSTAEDRLGDISTFLNSLFARLTGKSN